MTAPWPWAGVGVATFVLREQNLGADAAGFIQLRKRASRPEADLLYLAPALTFDTDGDSAAEGIWRRLLMHCCREAGQYGLERIYVSIPEDGHEAGCLTDAGFRPYATETIYRLGSPPALEPELSGFRRQGPHDSWALQRLYMRSTPRLVQHAEGALTGRVGSPPLSWWEPQRWRGIVWAPAGEVRGAVQVHSGRAGHWLNVWGASALTARELRNLIQHGLRLLSTPHLRWPGRGLPVYGTVRDYEIGLSGALTGFGFAPYVRRTRYVRHTTVPCREPAPAALPAISRHDNVPVHSQASVD